MGVSNADVEALLERRADDAWRRGLAERKRQHGKPQYEALQQRSYFVVACLRNVGKFWENWRKEITKLLLALGGDEKFANVFLSVYESGSRDGSPQMLKGLGDALGVAGIGHSLVSGKEVMAGRHRIAFLAMIRNKAMEPLLAAGARHYDFVIWLSDNLFCASGLVRLVVLTEDEQRGGSGADAACGLDLYHQGGKCHFYDLWAAHDIGGYHFDSGPPYVIDKPSRQAVTAGEPFPAFSCWNAMLVYRADIFTKERLTFRRSRIPLKECAVAETEMIFRDMWQINRGKVVVDPTVHASYHVPDFYGCVRPSELVFGRKVEYRPAPEKAHCCPMAEHRTWVDFGQCRMEAWADVYKKSGGGVPRRNDKSTPDSSPALRGGRQLEVVVLSELA